MRVLNIVAPHKTFGPPGHSGGFFRSSPSCIVRQQRAHIWHAGIPRCISQAREPNDVRKADGHVCCISILTFPWRRLLPPPQLSTFPLLHLYISNSVCPVNTHARLLFICLHWKKASGWSPWQHSRGVLRVYWNRWAIFCLSPESLAFSYTRLHVQILQRFAASSQPASVRRLYTFWWGKREYLTTVWGHICL